MARCWRTWLTDHPVPGPSTVMTTNGTTCSMRIAVPGLGALVQRLSDDPEAALQALTSTAVVTEVSCEPCETHWREGDSPKQDLVDDALG